MKNNIKPITVDNVTEATFMGFMSRIGYHVDKRTLEEIVIVNDNTLIGDENGDDSYHQITITRLWNTNRQRYDFVGFNIRRCEGSIHGPSYAWELENHDDVGFFYDPTSEVFSLPGGSLAQNIMERTAHCFPVVASNLGLTMWGVLFGLVTDELGIEWSISQGVVDKHLTREEYNA